MSAYSIVLWLCVIMFFGGLLFHVSRERSSLASTRSVARDAVFLALIALMGFVPQLGYITIAPGLSLTLIHLPVLIGAALNGPKKGFLFGLFFGVTSWLQAVSSPVGFNAFFVYPWISVLPRALFGFLAGFFFKLAKQTPKIGRSALTLGVISFLMTMLHTILVFATLLAFYPETIISYFQSSSVVVEVLSLTFLGTISVGAVLEALVAAILVPLLYKATSRHGERI